MCAWHGSVPASGRVGLQPGESVSLWTSAVSAPTAPAAAASSRPLRALLGRPSRSARVPTRLTVSGSRPVSTGHARPAGRRESNSTRCATRRGLWSGRVPVVVCSSSEARSGRRVPPCVRSSGPLGSLEPRHPRRTGGVSASASWPTHRSAVVCVPALDLGGRVSRAGSVRTFGVSGRGMTSPVDACRRLLALSRRSHK